MSSEIKPGSSLGYTKFNTVGREEAATQVLKQEIDPATRMRNIIIAIVAVLALGGIVYAGFKENGKKIFEQPTSPKQFVAPTHDLNN